MKQLLCISVFFLLMTGIRAQTSMPAETARYFSSIGVAAQGEVINGEWLAQHFPELPTLSIGGEYHLSLIARVQPGFTGRDLPYRMILGTRTGEIVTLKIPVSEISGSMQFKHIDYLEIAGRIQVQNHKLTADVRADSVWQGIGLPQSYTGKGVLIGITDWGFDYEHPMFMDTTLTYTRIRAAWDQFKLSGPPPSGMSYGTEYTTPAALMAAKSDTAGTYYDYATHGSHVAGIAAGSGAGTIYRGVAFGAEYLFNSVLLDVGSAIDAFHWMKSIADADGKRLVINMSWGLYHIGTMDGTSMISQVIDAMSDQGVVFVTSAGNNGDVNFHIRKDFNQDTIRTRIAFYPYNQHPVMWGQCVTMWGEPNQSFGVKLEVYNASNVLIGSSLPFITQAHPGYHDTLMVAGTDTIEYNLTIDDIHPLNTRPHIRLRVRNTNTTYRIVLTSFAPSGRVHYWNVVELSNGVGNWGLPFTAYGTHGVSGDSWYGLGEPACTEKAITVAAHISETISGTGVQVPGSRPTFSSKGPTYDERIKPDISAPGSNVISSINSYTTASFASAANVVFNGRTYHFSPFSGTSMSSPAAAGVAALVLEANPLLSAGQVREILKVTARQDIRTGVIAWPGSTTWGMGKVTATDAVLLAVNTFPVANATLETTVMVYPNPVLGHLFIECSSEIPAGLTYSVRQINGQLVASGKIYGTSRLDASAWKQGVYLVSIGNQTTMTTLKVVKI
jgi:minor extracellular serine protease Vpr